MEQQRLHQEDRVRRALERAQAEPKKKVGIRFSLLFCNALFEEILQYYFCSRPQSPLFLWSVRRTRTLATAKNARRRGSGTML